MAEFRSGFVCFVGRPNTGKSTLTNALVGEKIAITSNRPQTTRHTIRGIVNRDDAQLILVDTPGLHRPRTLLGQRLNDLVRDTYSEVDVIGVCVPADESIGPGDRWIVSQVRQMAPRTTVLGVVTKIDRVTPDRVAAQLVALAELLGPDSEVVPVSAKSGKQLDVLTDVLVSLMEPGPAFYPDGELTDEPEEVLMAEFIREAALEGVRDELPHSLAVVIEEIIPRHGDGNSDDDNSDGGAPSMVDVHALLYVERDSQKGIIIGHRGARLKEVGTVARAQIEKLLGTKVYLDLHVKVAKDWQRDPKQLGRMGF
ncbi:GTPase Era [Gordonia sp. PKS22-38]|uniref:GTPase Era n=1 Tax=Gordonia prachuapensis TaxID=3115651 RepID=A0ABU7MU61_9ACTN|nr:GTPase Era [Gordonia sp. PKS22-38]